MTELEWLSPVFAMTPGIIFFALTLFTFFRVTKQIKRYRKLKGIGEARKHNRLA